MAETVTLSRAEYEEMQARLHAYDRLREAIDDVEDLAIAAERQNDETIPFEMAERLLDGANPVTIWREYRGLSQRALAKTTSISPAMLNEIERGKRQPSLDNARALARALAVDLDDLFGE